MKYQIKRGSTDLIEISPVGTQTRQAMGVNTVDMAFTLQDPVNFLKGDWCVVYGEKYYFINDAPFKKVNERQYDYAVKLVHEFYSLQDVKYMGVDNTAALSVLRFSLMGDAVAHMELLIQNANRVQSGWTLGVIDATISKNISYDGENLLQVLNRLASEFDTEYWIENKTIHLAKRTGDSGIVLGYGRDKGLLNLSKSNKDEAATIFTRLYVEGGGQNLPTGYRNGAKALLLPGVPYVQNVDLINLYGMIEGFQAFEDIFPKRVGTITGVGDEFTFTDSGIDFDVNEVLIAGTTAKLIFQTGLLAGYQFELSTFDNISKTFVFNEIKEQASSTGVLPNSTLRPAIGDEYILVDIQMPASYVANAENELLTAAYSYYEKGSDIDFNTKYSGDCDPLFFKRHAVDLHDKLGFTVNIFEDSPTIDVDKRMQTIKRDLQNTWKYEIEFTDKIELSNIARTYAENKKTTQLIYGTVGYGGNGGNGSGGSNYFLSQLSGNNGYLYIAGVKVKAGFADMAQDAIHAFNADLALVANVAREVVSVDYVSGFAGTGHKLVGGVLEVDHIIARKSFETYELIRRKVTGIGGSFAVTDDMKILTVTGSNPYICTFDTDNNTIPNYFQIGDIVRCQTFDGASQKYYVGTIQATTLDSFTLQITEGSGIPAPNDVLFRFDSNLSVDRKGLIYMSNTDSGAPYLDVAYGFYTNPSTKTKVRLGKLDGIYDVDFGGFLSGWGLYGDNVYLKNLYARGQIIALPGSNVYNKTEMDGAVAGINAQIIALDTELTKYASDGVLNGVTEKQPIKLAYDTAANEVEDLKTQAAVLGVSSVDYNNAFLNLQSFVTPLLFDLSSVSPVDGVQLRDKFNHYGVQKSLLVKSLQTRQKELADNANTKIDNLKIGGENLVNKSRLQYGFISESNGVGITRYATYYHDPIYYDTTSGEEFVLSVHNPTPAGGFQSQWISWYDSANTYLGKSASVLWGVTGTVTIKAPANAAKYRYTIGHPDLKIKLERGNLKTDYNESTIDIIARTAKLITLSGTANIITVAKNGAITPAAPFTITAVAQNTTISSWQYFIDGGSWSNTLPTGVTRSGDVVTINPATITFKVLSIRASDGTYSDTFTVAKAVDGQDGANGEDGKGIEIKGSVPTYAALPTTGLTAGDSYLVEEDGLLYIYTTSFPANGNGVEFKGDPGQDGQDGQDAYTVLLTNESHTFAGTETAAIAASTATDIITYKGATPIGATITIGTLPTGLTANLSGNTITFNATSSLVSAGSVDITIVIDGKTFVRKFSFAISFKGAAGKSVTGVDAEFAKTNSATVAPTTGWQTTAPAWGQGYFIWSRQKTTYSDGTSTTTPAINITGSAGANGKSIASIEEEYYLSTSKTTPAGGSWSSTQPTWEKGKYLATRIKITYSNPTSVEYTNPVFSTEWEAVNQIKLGGANLLHKSRLQYGFISESNGVGITRYATYYHDPIYYDTTSGEEFVLSVHNPTPAGRFESQWISWYDSANTYLGKSASVLWGVTGTVTIKAPANAAKYRITIGHPDLKIKLEKGNIATDYSISDIDQQAQITAAQTAASNAQTSVTSLNTYVDGVFKDGVVDQAEAKAIEKYINIVNETYEQLVKSYDVVYNDPLLTGTPKTNLATAKGNLDTSKNALISAINTAIADGKTTVAEKAAVDATYADFKTKIGLYTTAIENAYKSITDALNVKTDGKASVYRNMATMPDGYKKGEFLHQTGTFTVDSKTWENNVVYIAIRDWVGGAIKTNDFVALSTKEGQDALTAATNAQAAANTANTNATNAANAATNAQAAANTANTNATNAANAATNAQAAANTANDKINSLKIGGSNLINKSRLESGFLSPDGLSITPYSAYRTDPIYYNCTANDEFVLTIYESILGAQGNWVHWYNAAGNGILATPSRYGVGSWKIVAPAGAVKFRYTIGHPDLKIKLEKGNIKSDWSESDVDKNAKISAKTTTFIGAIAPASPVISDIWFDTTSKIWKKWNGAWETVPDSFVGTAPYLTTALASSTEIRGGLILNYIIGVRNSGSVTAYMNGVNSNPIAFAAGVTNFGVAGSETQKAVIRHDGSGFLANGNIAWNTAGNVAITGAITATSGVFSGTVNATSGIIGGFIIDSNQLRSGGVEFDSSSLVLDAADNTLEFYSGSVTSNGLASGTLYPDIALTATGGYNIEGSIRGGGIRVRGYKPNAGHVKISEITGGGIFSNGGSTAFTPGSSGITTAASVVGLLQESPTPGFGGTDVAAAVAGFDQVGSSISYGGWFNSIFSGGVHYAVATPNTSSAYTCTSFDVVVSTYGSGNIYLPSIKKKGRMIYIKPVNNNITIGGNGSNIINWNGDNVGSITLSRGDGISFIWDGSYWLAFINVH